MKIKKVNGLVPFLIDNQLVYARNHHHAKLLKHETVKRPQFQEIRQSGQSTKFFKALPSGIHGFQRAWQGQL